MSTTSRATSRATSRVRVRSKSTASSTKGHKKEHSSTLKKEHLQLHETVEELKRHAERHAVAEEEQRNGMEYLENQVRALKGAFNTLSEVMVEEIEVRRRGGATVCACVCVNVLRVCCVFVYV